jgi:ABC-type transport system involved in cytochrome c biogenesis permease subunit
MIWPFFSIAFFTLVIACAVQAAFLLRDKQNYDPASHWLLPAAALLLLAGIIERSILIQFAAVTNTFESLILWAFVLTVILFAMRLRRNQKPFPFVLFGGTLTAIVLLAIASSPIAPPDIMPPIPALQSYWLVLHVICSFIGEAFFVVAFITAIYYLTTKDQGKKENLDRLTYTSIAIGYPVFTAGALIFGAIWASYAWGRFWGWDPKETWALITWLTYTGYLHFRLIRKKQGTVTAWLSIIGFGFTLFTFFGVNFLLPGLHSYG